MTTESQEPLVVPRVAVLLYGLLREFKTTAPSFLRHVVTPNNASVFYFGPAETDAPDTGHKGRNDIFGSFVHNPKSKIDAMSSVDIEEIRKAYGSSLKATGFHQEPQRRFISESEQACRPSDWLFMMNPARMFSMFFNIQGVVRLYLQHEEKTGEQHDTIIITRPDLAYYSRLATRRGLSVIKPGEVHIPDGEGFTEWGQKHFGNAPVLHYKNVETGDFVPGGRQVRFNDQIIMLNRADLGMLTDIHAHLRAYMLARVPASPETVLYLHLTGRGGLLQVNHPEWLYEIHRTGARKIQNLTDTTEIALADRRHPAGAALRKKHPVTAALRDVKQLWRQTMWRLRR